MVRIGTSGWSYPHWRGALYASAPQARWLEIYQREFDTVELNASFYRWPPPARFAAWRDKLPEGFEMTVKAPRGLTQARAAHRAASADDGTRRRPPRLLPRGPARVDAPGGRVPARFMDG